MNKTIHKTATVVKEMPAGLSQPNHQDGFWAYITREVVDSSGDIVRVEGVNFSPYHNPPDSHMKILAQHIRALPDGTAPIVGRVEEIVPCESDYKGAMVKSLAVRVSWAKDGSGQLMPLAKHYKDLLDGGYLDQLSVGILVDDFEELENGLDITKSTIFEASLVTIPANAAATVIKAVDSALGDLVEVPKDGEYEALYQAWMALKDEKKKAANPPKCPDCGMEMICPDCDMKGCGDKKPKKELAEPYAQTSVAEEVRKELLPVVESIKALTERFDVLESAIVVLSSPPTQATDDHKNESVRAALEAVSKKMDETLKYIS